MNKMNILLKRILKLKYVFSLLLALITVDAMASDLRLSKPIFYKEKTQSFAVLNLSWENAWRNNRNHDAVWLFFKFLNGNDGYVHSKILERGHEVILVHSEQNLQLEFEIPADRIGVSIYPKIPFRGHVEATIKIILDRDSFQEVNTRASNFSVYGIEMVKIPRGGFTLGDPDTSALSFGSLYKSNAQGSYKGLFSIRDENQRIKIAPAEDALYYRAPEGYEGDQTGIIPEAFPKGVEPFYIMKYEPTQGQYAEFLNSLSENQSQNRANFGGKNYYNERGSIIFENNEYIARNPSAPCNYMSWDDAMAFADWSGLRPMTEFEFTKAARGVKKPLENEFPWGTGSKEMIQRIVSENGTLTMLNGWDESKLSNDNKEIFGASFYWVRDLSGSLWERVITIGDSNGRAFLGTTGDGKLSSYGFATNDDWPKGIAEEGGFGFRGGGFYGHGRDYHDFNPYSPISYRPYGAWSGGNRTKAYGARFVRSTE